MTQHRFRMPAVLVAVLLAAACGGPDSEPAGDAPIVTPTGQQQPAPGAAQPAQPVSEIPQPATPGPAGQSDQVGAAPTAEPQGRTETPSTAASPAGTAPGPVTQVPAPAGTAANDILERAERAYAQVRSMEADFVQKVYVPLLEATVNSRGKIYHRAPDRFLMRFTDPQGDVIVADGQYVWMYYPSNDPRQVMRGRLAEGGQQVDLQREFLSDATERYSATRTGAEPVGGRQAHALTLVPRGPSPYQRIRIWVDTQDFLVRRFEIIETNESVRDLEMSNLRPNVSLDDSLFQFTPPPGAQVIEP